MTSRHNLTPSFRRNYINSSNTFSIILQDGCGFELYRGILVRPVGASNFQYNTYDYYSGRCLFILYANKHR